LLNFNIQLSLGDVTLTPAEAKKLLSESDGLAFIKNKWVEIDHGKLNELLSIYEKARTISQDRTLTIIDAMRFQFMGDRLMPVLADPDIIEITNGAWLRNMLTSLVRPDSLPKISCGKNFKASLRHYQKQGLHWLHYMRTLCMGALLADDMGLGKTIQVLALLNFIHNNSGGQKVLLVVPASLIGNWISEIERFTPVLSYAIIHPSHQKEAGSNYQKIINNKALSITTYGLLSKYDWLQNIQWDCLVIDEAQAIKNPGTKQSKAIKRIKSNFRIAMTGTPIENRLTDLWSLFDFLNPGLLGSLNEFTRFTKGLKDNPEGHKKLKKNVSPFILRRLKTDTSIISDFPEKIEMKTFAALTKKQAVLYADLVAQLKWSLDEVDQGIQRKGIILGSLIKFKQICNHPDQYLGQQQYHESESGKFARLREICETIAEKRERVLVFTQFKEITAHLAEFLENVFVRKGLVLHGEVAVKKRKEIVAVFQGDAYVPYMVLSIKAGGVGLNLTAANHVIHFDRWWNPAVEDQATDRAFRIGQKKNVVIHKFITEGTLEEKINLLIEDKQKLVRDIIPEAQEKWISEMSNEELFRLLNPSA
jgi:non-specific serine/threonine protein kinase